MNTGALACVFRMVLNEATCIFSFFTSVDKPRVEGTSICWGWAGGEHLRWRAIRRVTF